MHELSSEQLPRKLHNWQSFHLFYHSSLSVVLQHFVQPAIGDLFAKNLVDNFFFVRYPLGGPHIRLRLHSREDQASEVADRLTTSAHKFLSRMPSTRSLEPGIIALQNRSILSGTPDENDDTVYPDNTFQAFPFVPETERYGGPEVIASSLDYFAISSAKAIYFFEVHAKLPWAQQLFAISQLLAIQAWAFSQDEDEFFTLLGSRANLTDPNDPLLRRGDDAFERKPNVFCAMLRRELDPCKHETCSWFKEAGRRLSRKLRPMGTIRQLNIGLSQMHMTANRLGLKNQEEIYLGRILWRAARELASTEKNFWRDLCATFEHGQSTGEVHDLLHVAFDEVFSRTPSDPIGVGP